MVCGSGLVSVEDRYYLPFKSLFIKSPNLKSLNNLVTLNPKEIPVPKMHGAIAECCDTAPIAFASTIDKAGNVNLSPFSFLIASVPIHPFSFFLLPAREEMAPRSTLFENVKESPGGGDQYRGLHMIEQMSLTSCEYPKGVNEFVEGRIYGSTIPNDKTPACG